MEEKKYRFSDTSEQVKEINRLFCLSTAIVNIVSFIFVFISYKRGFRSSVYTFSLLAIMFVTSVGSLIYYYKKPHSAGIRYFVMTGLLVITPFLAYGFNADYMRVMAMIPFMGCVLFFDTRFSRISAIGVSLENLAVTLVRQFVVHNYEDDTFMTHLTISAVILTAMLIICYLTKVGKHFNDDSTGCARYETEIQKQMLDDVLEIAEQIRTSTTDAMHIVDNLQESSETVSQSATDISTSTMQAAEEIQAQNIMTQEIQNNLEQTVQYAEDMVRVAGRSNEMNTENAKHMENLREEAATLAKNNTVVADSMNHLQQNVNNVKNITQTIFDISSQTNLLALNASIESARAGEAGRGFAVVADEIRSLSERTRQETENISNILEQLEDNANKTAQAVLRSVEIGNSQDEMISEVSGHFVEMNTNVSDLIAYIHEIEKMLEELAHQNTEMVSNITQISASAEEVTASALQSAELTRENFQNAQHTKDILDGVLRVSHKIDKYMN